MLENEMLASEVYMLIDELDLRLDKITILSKINTILNKYAGLNRTMQNV